MSRSIKHGINITYGNLTATNIVSTSVTAGAIHATDVTTGNINVIGNLYQNGDVYVPSGGGGVSSPWTSTNGNLYYKTTAGNSFVGINTSSPTSSLDVIGSARFTIGLTTGSIMATGLVSAANIKSTTTSVGNLLANNVKSTNVTMTNVNISVASAGTIVITNSSVTNETVTNINISAANIGSLVVTDSNATNSTTTNLVATSCSIGNLVSTSASIGAVIASQGVTASNMLITTVQNQTLVLADIGAIGANNIAMQYQVGGGANGSHVFYTNSTTGQSNEAMGIERLQINGQGNIGVGTNTPSTKLHVVGDVLVDGLIMTTNILATNVSTGTLTASGNSNTLGSIITKDGNVGINTSAPVTKLHIGTPMEQMITLFNGNDYYGFGAYNTTANYMAGNNAHHAFYTNSSLGNKGVEVMRVDENSKLTVTSVSTSNVNTGTLTSSGLSNLQNVTSTNVSASTLTATGITTGGLLVTGLVSAANLATTTATIPNVVHTNVSTGTLSASGISTLQDTSATNISADTIVTTSQASLFSVTTGNINASGNMRLAGDLFVGGTVTAVNVTSVNLIQNNISTGTLIASGASSLQNVTATNMSASTLTATGLSALQNVTSTNVSTSTLTASGLSILQNVTATNETLVTLIATTGITTGGLLATGLISSANLYATTATLPNVIHTNISTSALIASGLSTLQNVTATNETLVTLIATTGITTGGLLATGLVSATNLFVTTATIPNVVHTNITTAQLTINSGTITNGNLLLNANNGGGVLNFTDTNHAIWGRKGANNTADVMQFREFGQFEFWNGGFIENQTAKMVITSVGNVGIGTTSPNSRLDMRSTNSLQITLQNTGSGASQTKIYSHSDSNTYFQSSGDTVFAAMGSTTSRITVTTSGNLLTGLISTSNLVVTNITANGVVSFKSAPVLIGTSTDLDTNRVISALDSNMTANDSVRWITWGQGATTNNQAELGFRYVGNNNTQNSLILGLYGGERMRIQANGNVGIGTIAPEVRLDVYSSDTSVSNLRVFDVKRNLANGAQVGFLFGKNDSYRNGIWNWYYHVGDGNGGNSLRYDFNGLNDVFKLAANGLSGFGTATLDKAKLQVNGFQSSNLNYGYLNSSGVVGTAGGSPNFSIYASDRIAASELNAFSDIRIKENIQDIDDLSALSTLRLIQPKKYNYIDRVTRGDTPVWGFIAQQVESVLDYSTRKIIDYIPNVYDIADVTNTDDVVYLKLKTKTTSGLTTTEPVKIKLFIDDKNTESIVTLKEIIDENTFTINESLSNTSQVFVYGIEVSDFHTLNKDAIYTINVAATQELDRELQTLNQQSSNIRQKYNNIIASLGS